MFIPMAWVLTEEAFSKLLESLDPDRERAGEKYEVLRRTLARFFEWRGAPAPEEHVDETLNRVARRLNEGQAVSNFGGYCYGVARLVMMESLKGQERELIPLEDANPTALAAEDKAATAAEEERRLKCLEECLRALPAESRELITEYYQDEKRDKINRRKALADRLGIPRLALGNRAQRLRDKLAQCVKGCLAKKNSDMNSRLRHS
jgi:RNA polymerase sigma factor (sigma-70 family)